MIVVHGADESIAALHALMAEFLQAQILARRRERNLLIGAGIAGLLGAGVMLLFMWLIA